MMRQTMDSATGVARGSDGITGDNSPGNDPRGDDTAVEEVADFHARSMLALSRATRLARLSSIVSDLTDVDELATRASSEIAELFSCDLAVFWLAEGVRVRLAAHWGVPATDLPTQTAKLPAQIAELTDEDPLLDSAWEDLPSPGWLEPYNPRQVVWARLGMCGSCLGYLLLARQDDVPFARIDLCDLAAVCSRIALAVDRWQLAQRVHQLRELAHRTHAFAERIGGMLDLSEVAEAVATTAVRETRIVGARIYLKHGSDRRRLATAGISSGIGYAKGELPMTAGSEQTGLLVMIDPPDPASEAYELLRHLAGLGGLALQRVLLFEHVREQAQRDPLTGLANRVLIMERLRGALRRRHSTVTVVFLNLDGFQAINNGMGRDTGDRLLTHVAQRLLRSLRSHDTVARLGGDEFLVLVDNLPNSQDADLLSGRLRSAVEQPLSAGDHILTPTVSIGVSVSDADGYDPDALVRVAERRMREQKRSHLGGS